MKRLTILIGLFVILLVIVVVGFIISPKQQPSIPMPTPAIPTITTGLSVLSSIPADETTNVSRDQVLTVTFSQPVTTSDFTVSVAPETAHRVTVEGTTALISPQTQWIEGMPYWVMVRYADDPDRLPYGFAFTVAGPTPETLPNTRPEQEVIDAENAYLREHDPDIYLSNYTPYGEESFSIVSYFNEEQDRYAFIVEPNVENRYAEVTPEIVAKMKADANRWMLSLGLTQQQINSLEIQYITE